MIQRLFDLATPLWRVMSIVGDLIFLNVLLIASLIPVFTAGAGFTALYDTVRKLQDNIDSGAVRTFITSFRSNFKGATAIWAVLGPIGIGIILSWIYIVPAELLVWKFLASFVYLLVFPLIWVMQARFVNTPMRTLRNGLTVAIGRLPFTFGAVIVHGVLIALTGLVWVQLPTLVIPLVLLGYPLIAYGCTPLLERAIAPLLPE